MNHFEDYEYEEVEIQDQTNQESEKKNRCIRRRVLKGTSADTDTHNRSQNNGVLRRTHSKNWTKVIFLFCVMFVFLVFSTFHIVSSDGDDILSSIPSLLDQLGTSRNNIDKINSHSELGPPFKKPYRTFPRWQGEYPCYPTSSKSKTKNRNHKDDLENHQGLLYVKTPKAASSTLSGVAMHIAERHYDTSEAVGGKGMSKKCTVNAHHAHASTLGYANRNKEKSFLWTFVRDPKKRALSSYFFFKATMQGENPTGEKLLTFLKGQSNFQTNYIRTTASASTPSYLANRTKNGDANNAIITEILNEYNFIGLVEKLDESLVVLRLLLNLDAKDILYLPAKQMGSFAVISDKECRYIYPKFTTPQVDSYLKGEQWQEENELDYALIGAVERSLYATIDMIGHEKYEKALEEHYELLAKVHEKCFDKDLYPCSEEGRRQKGSSCYWNDIGCGHECIDKL